MTDDPMDAIRQSFFEECRELLEELEQGLLALQDGSADEETIGAVFRAVHSIKGGAGAFALDALTRFAHDFETVLDHVRSSRLALNPDLTLLLLRSADVLADITNGFAEGDPHDETQAEALKKELAAVAASVDGGESEESVADLLPPGFAPVALDLDLDDGGIPDLPDLSLEDETPALIATPQVRWHLRIEPLPGLLASGNEPLFLFRALSVFGEVEANCDMSGLPAIEELGGDDLWVSWDVYLYPGAPDLTQTELEAVFDFAEDLCDLTITREEISEDEQPTQTTPKPGEQLAEILEEPAPAPPSSSQADQAIAEVPPAPSDAVAQEPIVPKPAAPSRPTPKVNSSEQKTKQQSSSVRVDLQRVDDLVNLVGEIVIAQAMLGQISSEPGREQEVSACLDQLNQLTLEFQDSVMAIRALPVRPLFQRMSRIVREAAQMTGKDVRLVTEGEDTQIDKTMIELMAEPLTHMVRNAVDHGLEDVEQRTNAGKPPQGTIRLSAAQRSDRVFVEISDDGAGINRDKVLAKARAQGLVEPDVTPEPAEIDRLLFLPGFSTSDKVTELSGRGVGMDVVNCAIQNLSGTVSIRSQPGEGTTLSVSLPLTLAILDGMILANGSDRFVMPLAAIVETMTEEASDIQSIAGGGQIVRVHGKYVPLFDLSLLLDQPSSPELAGRRTILLIDPGDNNRYALMVDDIEAQRQVVVKGLAQVTGRIPGISAATILGTGRIALILDGAGLRQLADANPQNQIERLAS